MNCCEKCEAFEDGDPYGGGTGEPFCSKTDCPCHQEKEIDKEKFIKWCALQPVGMLLDFSEQWFEKGRAADRAALVRAVEGMHTKPAIGISSFVAGYHQALDDVLALLAPEKN